MDKLFFIISLLYASTCFEHYVLIIRRSKLYFTSYGIISPVGGRPVHRLRGDSSLNLCTCRAQIERGVPNRTHNPRSGSENHHPSTDWMQKTICCNLTFSAPDDGRMRPKHVELKELH